jgi:hypothetical protein
MNHLLFLVPLLIRMITIMKGPTIAIQKMTKITRSVSIVDIGGIVVQAYCWALEIVS